MVTRPKRKKSSDNPYTLIVMEDNKYFVKFKDGRGITTTVEISKEVFDGMDKFELEDISQMHKFDKHIEHSELYEETLYSRALVKEKSLEDEVIEKATFEDLRNAINELPEIQRRRIRKYYFYEMTQQQIADEEGTSIRAIQYSLKCAIDNLKEKLKKLKN